MFRHLKHQIARGAITLIAATGLIPSRSSERNPELNVSLARIMATAQVPVAAIKVIAPHASQSARNMAKLQWQQPLFQLLGSPEHQKKHVIFETGHFPPPQNTMKEALEWFDRYLGVVGARH